MNKRFLTAKEVVIKDPYWSQMQELTRTVVLPYQWKLLNDEVEGAEKSHCIANFEIAAGLRKGEYAGAVFQDSDLYKWLHAVGCSLAWRRDEALESLADEAILLIGKAQRPDGYLNTYFTIAAPDERWQNLMEGHELYCAGHFIEAACAYYAATGKRPVMEIAEKLCACIAATFGKKARRGYPGHPEIEVALFTLYELTGNKQALELSCYFLNERGHEPYLFAQEAQRESYRPIFREMADFPPTYFQAHQPVREQRVAHGHAVRAMYLYSAMADMARLTGEDEMRKACETLYENTTRKQMYVTGGIGSAAYGERFTCDYDLPNDTMYCETCASIGLMMFSQRMYLLTGDASCYDVWQRALENTVMAGMSADGKRYFYVNPLDVRPAAVKISPTLSHVCTQRPQWYAVACCPPNVARTVCGLGEKIFTWDGSTLEVLAHIGAEAAVDGQSFTLSREGDCYRLAVSGAPCTLRMRMPDGYRLQADGFEVESGFFTRRHNGGEAVYTYSLEPVTRFVWANPRVSADQNRVALLYGQRVYCLEEVDNGAELATLRADASSAPEAFSMEGLSAGLPAFHTRGCRLEPTDTLYSEQPPKQSEATLTWIPYCSWGNRGEGEMTCWVGQQING